MDLAAANRILRERHGHTAFRGLQERGLSSLFEKHNTLLVMPTGGGKSVCYQIPAEMAPGLTLVVSPLIALMKDQVDQLRAKGFPHVYALHSNLSREERESVVRKLGQGRVRLLYVTPERFRNTAFMEAVASQKLELFVVDEAHCISQWGHDFRPEYSRLGEIRQQLGQPLTLALTATAPPAVRQDIRARLALEPCQELVESVFRPNLYLSCLEVYGLEEKLRSVVGLRHRFPGASVLYFSLISSLYKFSEELRKVGLSHQIYHGDLDPQSRRRVQEEFLVSKDGLLLATPAFGLGVDKPDLRLLMHSELPGSIEAYFQEVGRAGRDGNPSHCFCFYDQEDLSIQLEFLKWSNPDPGFIQTLFRLIEKNLSRVKAEGLEFLKQSMNFYNSRDYRVETALGLMARYEVIEWPHRNFSKLELKGDIPPEMVDTELYDLRMKELQQKLLQMVEFTRTPQCRQQEVRLYFGEGAGDPCGFCDRCQPLI